MRGPVIDTGSGQTRGGSVLHPTDFSAQARAAERVASGLARKSGRRVVLLHVLAPMPLFGRGRIKTTELPRFSLAQRRSAKAALTEWIAALREQGVVAAMHAAAWKRLFDEYLAGHVAANVVPFDIETDYRRYVDGKPRTAGVRSFPAARGIELPAGAEPRRGVEVMVRRSPAGPTVADRPR